MTFMLGVAATVVLAWLGVAEKSQGSDEVAAIVDLEQRLAQAWVKRDHAGIPLPGAVMPLRVDCCFRAWL